MKTLKYCLLCFAACFTCGPAFGQNNVPEPGAVSLPAVTSFPDFVNYTGAEANRNFVRSFIPSKPVTDPSGISLGNQYSLPCITATKYFDGLGRPLQEVVRSGTNHVTSADLVSVHTYDALGRESYNYLPYSTNDLYAPDHGRLKVNPKDGLSAQYQSLYPGQQPYGRTVYDGSPLNRPIKTYAPGAAAPAGERNTFTGQTPGTMMSVSGPLAVMNQICQPL